MKNSIKKPLTLATATLLASVMLVGCSPGDSDKEKTPNKDNTDNKVEPKDSDETKEIDGNLSEDEAKRAAEAYPDVEATEHMSKEDVQIALLNMTEYRDTVFTDGYLLSGAWMNESEPFKALMDQHGRFYSENAQEYILRFFEAYVAEAESGNEDILSTPAFQNMFGVFPFMDDAFTSEDTKPVCVETDEIYDCLNGEEIVVDGETQYGSFDKDTLETTTVFQIPLRWTSDGKEGVLMINYELTLEMKRNPAAQPDAGHASFVVDGSKSSYELEPFKVDNS